MCGSREVGHMRASGLCVLVFTAMCSGRLLRCACNTQHCRSTSSRSCTTQYKCYMQYLERSDGSNPLTTGCISGNTPLLCENRLPAVTHANWPYLVCCDSGHMCNLDTAMPSPPLWAGDHNASTVAPPPDKWSHHATGTHHLMSNSITSQPIVMAVLVVGLFLLAGIMGFGFYVLKKQSNYLQQTSSRQAYPQAKDYPDTGQIVPLPPGTQIA